MTPPYYYSNGFVKDGDICDDQGYSHTYQFYTYDDLSGVGRSIFYWKTNTDGEDIQRPGKKKQSECIRTYLSNFNELNLRFKIYDIAGNYTTYNW